LILCIEGWTFHAHKAVYFTGEIKTAYSRQGTHRVSKQPIISQNLIENAAALIKTIHTPEFPEVLCHILRNATPFDSTVIYAYDGGKPPIDLFHSPDDKPSLLSLEEYQRGAFLLDPVFHAYQHGTRNGVHRLKDLAPDHFFRSEYYHSYYEKTQIVSEVVIYITMPDTGTVVISLSREKGSPPFRKKTIERLQRIEPIVREAIIRHWRNPEIFELSTPPGKDRFDALPGRVHDALVGAGRAALTKRETEVSSLILRGYSSAAIASLLNIFVGTVKVHRKNIYAKLEISSQGELFSLFLPLLTRPAS